MVGISLGKGGLGQDIGVRRGFREVRFGGGARICHEIAGWGVDFGQVKEAPAAPSGLSMGKGALGSWPVFGAGIHMSSHLSLWRRDHCQANKGIARQSVSTMREWEGMWFPRRPLRVPLFRPQGRWWSWM